MSAETMEDERTFLLDVENDLQALISLIGHECDFEILALTARKARAKVNERLVDLWAKQETEKGNA